MYLGVLQNHRLLEGVPQSAWSDMLASQTKNLRSEFEPAPGKRQRPAWSGHYLGPH